MTRNPLNLTPQQLAVYKVIQHNYMAWVALIVILTLFAIGFLCFLYAIFWVGGQGAPKSILGGIDGLLGWCVRIIIKYLFPSLNPAERE
jgi:hypothetical protein